MIIAYDQRPISTGDPVADGFSWGRFGLIERRAKERGLRCVRQVGLAPGPRLGLVEYLTVGVDLGADDADPKERFASFLGDVEDAGLGPLRLWTDDERERLVLDDRNARSRATSEGEVRFDPCARCGASEAVARMATAETVALSAEGEVLDRSSSEGFEDLECASCGEVLRDAADLSEGEVELLFPAGKQGGEGGAP